MAGCNTMVACQTQNAPDAHAEHGISLQGCPLGSIPAVVLRMHYAVSGTYKGCITTSFALVGAGHPFDTIKVRLQTQGSDARFGGPIDCLRQTVQREGFRGLYKGASPPLATFGFINSILFGLQSMAVDAVKGKENAHRPPTVQETMKAAVLSGFAISFIVQPIEGVKARLQVQYDGPTKTFAGPIDCIRKVVGKLGVWRGLYRGWTMTALCRMSNYAYFGPYELLRKQFGMTSGSSGGRSMLQSLGVSVLCGSLTGVCYWTCCYPFDVVKNRIQAAPDTSPPLHRNGWHCAQEIYRAKGWRGFLAGFSPCLLRSVPANAAAFTAYELTMHFLPMRTPSFGPNRS